MSNDPIANAIRSIQDISEELNSIIYYYNVGNQNADSLPIETEFSAPVIDSFETVLSHFLTTTTMLIRLRNLFDGRDSDADYLNRLKTELTVLGSMVEINANAEEPNQAVVIEVLEAEINRLKQDNNALHAKLELLEEIQAA